MLEVDNLSVRYGPFLALDGISLNVQPGEIFNVSYREGMATQVRVHGQLYLIAGVLLLMPLLGALAVEFSREWLGVQVSFAAIMAVVMVGGWVLLKLVRRNY